MFHPLPVAAVDRLTEDALAITFVVPGSLRKVFAFRAGQHVTVRHAAGDEVRRSYSICSTPDELATRGRLRIGVKEIPGGVFSRYAAQRLAPGDEVEVMPAAGRFTLARPGPGWYAAIAAGSGITPVLSLIATALAEQPASRFTLLYGNRYSRSVMFVEELSDLKDRFPDRLQVVHVLSREAGSARLLAGRIDADRLPRLLDAFVPGPVDEWFLCGPYQMVLDARGVLAARGVAERIVHTELFHVPTAGDAPPPPAEPPGGDVAATIVLDGRATSFAMGYGERVLDAALRVRGELPYSCRGGVCSTCRARVVDGEVKLAQNWALHPDELAKGYVLTCQAIPVTGHLTIDYDA